jgi:serine/threonine protein kinase/Flp pilus assembly protein TadD
MAAADRDLLFGLLALQNGLIDQGQLVAAFQAWTRERSRPLAEHLVTRGDLDADDRAAVEAFVTRHLNRHGGDAQRTLAAIPAGRSTRERLAALGDPELTGTVAHVGSGSVDPDADRTATYAVGASSADGQRFRVLRPHARGGLGAVFVALDGELNREVALKQILDAHADDPVSRQRFLNEAEITGGLEHPGVVPVYSLGAYKDGRPYYAMRLIRGDSLKEAIERFHKDETLKQDAGRRSLELRKLLRRFLDVCNAIDYAHSRGVLHRDIKPGNIIVGKHGETLVVDWGLARAKGHREESSATDEATLMPSSASGSAETLPGQALGTPAYMSPEQARGDLGALGPRSDVYSLGATLYCLLTGKPPLEGDVADVLRAVQRGEFAPPRRIDPSIDGALEAVCLRALATDPAARYDSARALAEDVERWMADEPVHAWREPWWRRQRRWLVRHRALVGGLLIAVPALILSLLAIVARERQTNQELGRNNRELEVARQTAEQARKRAEGREDLALKAIDNYREVVEKNPDLLTRPDLKELRDRLLEAPHDFYRQLKEALEREKAESHELTSGLDEKLMRANFSLAWLNAESGTLAEAAKSYQEAATILEPLVGRHNNPEQGHTLAMVYNNLGNALIEAGRFDEARAALEKALALREGEARERPDEIGSLRDRSYIEHNLGWLDSKVGRPESSLAHYRKAVALREEVLRRSPDRVEYGGELAKTLGNLGFMLAAVGRNDEAEAAYRQGVALLEPVVAARPNVVTYRSDLAELLRGLGEALGEHGGRPCFAQATELGEAIVAEVPTVPRFRSELAMTLMLSGSLARKWKAFDEAIATQRRAVALDEALARDFPDAVQYRIALSNSLVHLGLTLTEADRPAEALPLYDRAKEVYAGIIRENPQDIAAASLLAGTFNNRGLALAKLDRHVEAVAEFREAIARERACLDRDPLSAQYRTWLGLHYMNLGKSLRALGRKDEALAVSLARFELLEQAPPEQRDKGIHYHVVCDLAQLIPLVGGDKPDAELSDAERAERRSYAERAIEEFRLALADGFSDVGLFARDPDLDPIRSHPEFRRLLDEVMDRALPADPFAHGPAAPPRGAAAH